MDSKDMQIQESNKVTKPSDETSQDKKYSAVEFIINPANYKKRLSDAVDRRFASIFLVSLFFNSIFAFWLSQIPYEATFDEFKDYQEHYANFIYEKAPEPEPPPQAKAAPEEQEDKKQPEEEKVEEEVGELAQGEEIAEEAPVETTSRERREANTRSTEEITQQASSMGLLALLSSSSENAKGEGVVDLLGDVESNGSNNLDDVISKIDGIKSSGSVSTNKNRSARGSRATDGGGGIDVAALTKAKGSKFGKKSGDLVYSNSGVEAEQGKTAGRSPEDVMKVVNSHASAIEYCYQRALRKNPSLKGKVSIRFVIRANGSVGDIKVLASTLGDPSVERCIKTKIKSWRDFGAIDPANGDAVFRQDYIFGY